jgi:hypothetical protein
VIHLRKLLAQGEKMAWAAHYPKQDMRDMYKIFERITSVKNGSKSKVKNYSLFAKCRLCAHEICVSGQNKEHLAEARTKEMREHLATCPKNQNGVVKRFSNSLPYFAKIATK